MESDAMQNMKFKTQATGTFDFVLQLTTSEETFSSDITLPYKVTVCDITITPFNPG